MTVETNKDKVVLPGNGTATTFSFSPIVIFETTDVEVTITDANGIDTLLTEGAAESNYSVVPASGSFPSLTGVTGSVTYPSTGATRLQSGETITIRRVLPLLQLTDLENQGGYFADVQETALDKIVMQNIQQQEELNRAIKLSVSETTTPTFPPVAQRANKFAAFNATGDIIASSGGPDSTVPVSPFMETLLDDLDAAAARTTLGAAATSDVVTLTGNETISGNKTFSGDTTFTGDSNIDGPLALGDGSELTIATGAITPTSNYHLVDTEADAATDDLTTLTATNIEEGGIVVLQPANDARTIVIKHAAVPSPGQIVTADGKDVSLEDIEDIITLKLRGTFWEEVSRSDRKYPAGTVVQSLLDTDETKAALTTSMPADDTVPQNTEGTEVFTITMTPKFANSKISLTVSGFIHEGTGAVCSGALFVNSDVNATRSGTLVDSGTGAVHHSFQVSFIVDATDTAERTYRFRIGPTSGTLNWLGNGAGHDYGNTTQGMMKVEEIAQ